MRFVDAAEVRRLLSFPVLIDALEAAHRRPKIDVLDGMMGSEKELYFVRSAVDRGRFMASKLITSFPANLAGGKLPAVQAVCALLDGSNGRPLAVIDGTEVTYWRTAANSGLGARLLAPPDAQTLLVVGAGQMSRWLVRAHRTARPSLSRVLIWNRTAARAAEVAASLAQEGIAAEATGDLDAATRIADVITTCTRSHTPLVKGANLKPGTHLDLVGGYTPQTREADDEAARRSHYLRRPARARLPRRGRHFGADCQRGDRRGRRAGRPLRPGAGQGRRPPLALRHHLFQERRRRPPRPDDLRGGVPPARPRRLAASRSAPASPDGAPKRAEPGPCRVQSGINASCDSNWGKVPDGRAGAASGNAERVVQASAIGRARRACFKLGPHAKGGLRCPTSRAARGAISCRSRGPRRSRTASCVPWTCR